MMCDPAKQENVRTDSGFTLLELVIALALLALMSVNTAT